MKGLKDTKAIANQESAQINSPFSGATLKYTG